MTIYLFPKLIGFIMSDFCTIKIVERAVRHRPPSLILIMNSSLLWRCSTEKRSLNYMEKFYMTLPFPMEHHG